MSSPKNTTFYWSTHQDYQTPHFTMTHIKPNITTFYCGTYQAYITSQSKAWTDNHTVNHLNSAKTGPDQWHSCVLVVRGHLQPSVGKIPVTTLLCTQQLMSAFTVDGYRKTTVHYYFHRLKCSYKFLNSPFRGGFNKVYLERASQVLEILDFWWWGVKSILLENLGPNICRFANLAWW